MRRKALLFMLVAVTGWSHIAVAGSADLSSLACGNQAIELGMSPEQIKSTCGQHWEPAFISKHERPALGADDGSSDHFEKWMYKEAGKKDTHVVIKNGEVVRIFTTR